MAKMIPASVPQGTPYSERRIFALLKSDPSTEDWTVLHSLGLSRTQIGPYGEIDFVILVPGKGIACLEVKGGEVSCSEGVWKTRNRKTGQISTLNKSPYLQARAGMFQLGESIEKHFGSSHPASRCPYSYAVVFPDVHAPPVGTEAEEWETIDIDTLATPISRLIARNLNKCHEKLDRKIKPEQTSKETIDAISRFLRPSFDQVIARSTAIHRTEEQLISLTEEQYDYLDIASANERALVTGAAGTGKTLLALEYARREAAEGRSVLFVCFNRILGDWLEEEISNYKKDNITTRTFHGYLRSVILNSSFREEFLQRSNEVTQAQVFSELYPFYGELSLSEGEVQFDTLIVDEAQDLVRQENFQILASLLRGGLAGGRWAMFGDFTRQAIYSSANNSTAESGYIELLRDHAPSFPIVPLRVNCRNTRQIGEEAALLSGFDSLPYRLSLVDGLSVDYRYFRNRDEEVEQIENVLSKLVKEGVEPAEVVILSPNRFENSAVSGVSGELEYRITDIRELEGYPKDCFVFSTVHAFKGMESSVVILTGFSDLSTDEQKSLVYVGMSRAKSNLVMIIGEKARKLIPGLVAKQLSEGWN